jgi:UDP-D-galactose:(glucosyl)LPS alpha-1,6-D-galactosyltransferase
MKKVAIICQYVSGKGGMETVIREVMKNFTEERKCDFEFRLFLTGTSKDKTWLAGLNYEAGSFSPEDSRLMKLIRRYQGIYKFIKKYSPDYIISTESRSIQVLFNLRRFLRQRFVIISWMHFTLQAGDIEEKLLSYADYHLSISNGISQQLQELGIDKNKIFVIFNPIDKTDSTITRPSDCTEFIFLGRIQYEKQKRLSDLLRAVSKLTGEWHLNIYGEGEDREKCQQYAIDLGIEQQITWKGWIDTPWNHITEATALVLTSAFEGLPMVLGEAISRGLYCVSSDCPTGPADIIKPEINGQLYKVNDLDQLREILQEIVDGRSLPKQDVMKRSIDFLYFDHYFKEFMNALLEIGNQVESR